MIDDKTFNILIVAICLGVVIRILVWYFNKKADPRSRIINTFRGNLIITGIFTVGMWWVITSSIDFHMPSSSKEFKSLDEVHAYLKEQSGMLSRLAMVMYWFLFIFAFNFLFSLYDFAKSIIGQNADLDKS